MRSQAVYQLWSIFILQNNLAFFISVIWHKMSASGTITTLNICVLVAFQGSSEGITLILSPPADIIVACFCCLFFCRVGQTGCPLCNVPESRHKDCEPWEAQRVGINEGKFAAFQAILILAIKVISHWRWDSNTDSLRWVERFKKWVRI